MKIRFSALAWNWGVDDFGSFALPSLLQAENLPWLVANDFDVTFTVYTIERDRERLRAIVEDAVTKASPSISGLDFRIEALDTEAGLDDPKLFKRHWYLSECRASIAEVAPLMFVTADLFFGNGSIRNVALSCRQPGIVAAGIYLRVKREAFLELLQEYRNTFGDAPISNPKLVDIGLRSQIEAIAESNVDVDRNAALRTGVAARKLADDLYGFVYHLPTPMMFWPSESDVSFFDAFGGGRFESFDHLWPAKLIAERRWRLLASSDLFFLVEVTPSAIESSTHSYATEEGHLYDESFYFQLPHTARHEMVLTTLRREPFLAR